MLVANLKRALIDIISELGCKLRVRYTLAVHKMWRGLNVHSVRQKRF